MNDKTSNFSAVFIPQKSLDATMVTCCKHDAAEKAPHVSK